MARGDEGSAARVRGGVTLAVQGDFVRVPPMPSGRGMSWSLWACSGGSGPQHDKDERPLPWPPAVEGVCAPVLSREQARKKSSSSCCRRSQARSRARSGSASTRRLEKRKQKCLWVSDNYRSILSWCWVLAGKEGCVRSTSALEPHPARITHMYGR